MFKVIKKADIVLFAVLMIIGIIISVFAFTSGKTGTKVVVTVDGQIYGTYSLAEDRVITIKQSNHTNKITIKNQSVQMTYSDCKNQVCVNDGKVTKTNQSIVCLPNKVMVEIKGDEEEFDAVSN